MNVELKAIFWAVFLCGAFFKFGEGASEFICYIIKQSYGIYKAKKELKRLKARNVKAGGVEQQVQPDGADKPLAG